MLTMRTNAAVQRLDKDASRDASQAHYDGV